MRPLRRRERVLAAVVMLVVVMAAADWWRSLMRHTKQMEEAEATVASLRVEARRVHGDARRGDQSIREAVRGLRGNDVKVVEEGNRVSVAWHGDGQRTWEGLASLSLVRDAAVVSLSLRNVQGALEVDVVMEKRGGS